MKNSDMIENRFGRWAAYRKQIAEIRKTLSNGGEIVIATYTRAVRYDARHIEMFKANKSGAWVQRGKSWEFIGLSKILHYRRFVA